MTSPTRIFVLKLGLFNEPDLIRFRPELDPNPKKVRPTKALNKTGPQKVVSIKTILLRRKNDCFGDAFGVLRQSAAAAAIEHAAIDESR